MTARLLKESRSLWPIVLVGVAGLLVCAGIEEARPRLGFATGILCLLCALVGISSMGFELLHGMHLSLFVQPVSREQSWRDKMIVQGIALGILTTAYAWVVAGITVAEPWWYNQRYVQGRVTDRLSIAMVAPLLALGCGTLFVLAIRHVQGAFCFLIGSAFALVVLLEAFWPLEYWYWKAPGFIAIASVLAMVGLILGRRQYLAFQNYSALDGVVSLAGGKDTGEEAGVHSGVVWLALKELHLHWVNVAVFLAAFGGGVVWGAFRTWAEWALMKDFVCLCLPLFAGAAAIAEERRLGVELWHATLPPTRTQQWIGKMMVCLAIGVGVGGLLYAGSAMVLPRESEYGLVGGWSISGYLLYAFMATVAGFFASSVSRHYIQAAVVVFGLVMVIGFFDQYGARWLIGQYGAIPCRNLFRLLLIPTLLVFFTIRGLRNFGSFASTGDLMRRNATGFLTCLAGVLVMTGLLYHRTWELVGYPKVDRSIKIPAPSALQLAAGMDFDVTLDGKGRLWSVKHDYDEGWQELDMPQLSRIGDDADWKSVAHPSWYRYGYGVLKSNGTLWVAAGSRYEKLRNKGYTSLGELSPELQNITPDFRWRDVVWHYHWLGISTNGSLWAWGSNRRAGFGYVDTNEFLVIPRQVGNDKDWKQLMPNSWMGNIALKEDGSVWEWGNLRHPADRNERLLVPKPRRVESLRLITFREIRGCYGHLLGEATNGKVYFYSPGGIYRDSPAFSYATPVEGHENLLELYPDIDWRGIESRAWDRRLQRTTDGRMWHYYGQRQRVPMHFKRRAIDGSSDWVAYNGLTWGENIGIKSDGSLWHWVTFPGSRENQTFYQSREFHLSLAGSIPPRIRPVKIGMLDPKLWR